MAEWSASAPTRSLRRGSSPLDEAGGDASPSAEGEQLASGPETAALGGQRGRASFATIRRESPRRFAWRLRSRGHRRASSVAPDDAEGRIALRMTARSGSAQSWITSISTYASAAGRTSTKKSPACGVSRSCSNVEAADHLGKVEKDALGARCSIENGA